ncbi:cobalt ECF transporter T component CbiQ [Methanolacinia petrolearia]|uniref:cobalt ECF transporter T component CbiQ n=1 Tax=Methanolacinia petrolearia TaxID=54120 RepID=UPI003BACBED8
MIEELYAIEKLAMGTSPIHILDSRIKIIICFAAIIAMVAYPYSVSAWIPGLLFFLFFLMLWVISELPVTTYLKRLVMILPFGIFIILFQIFFENSHYDTFTVLVPLPLGINIYSESVEFAAILFVKFIICISFIILLSSTTPMQNLLTGARRLGLPPEFALVIGLMIRYLFVFAEMFGRVMNVFETKCFNSFDRSLPYKYRLKILGYTVGTMFIRSYEQGERTYISMLCRGYSKDSYLQISKKEIKPGEWIIVCIALTFIIMVPLVGYFSGI